MIKPSSEGKKLTSTDEQSVVQIINREHAKKLIVACVAKHLRCIGSGIGDEVVGEYFDGRPLRVVVEGGAVEVHFNDRQVTCRIPGEQFIERILYNCRNLNNLLIVIMPPHIVKAQQSGMQAQAGA